jgi:hypothetical protein
MHCVRRFVFIVGSQHVFARVCVASRVRLIVSCVCVVADNATGGSSGDAHVAQLHGRQVAVKAFHVSPKTAKAADTVSKFCKEVVMMTRLNHPNVLAYVPSPLPVWPQQCPRRCPRRSPCSLHRWLLTGATCACRFQRDRCDCDAGGAVHHHAADASRLAGQVHVRRAESLPRVPTRTRAVAGGHGPRVLACTTVAVVAHGGIDPATVMPWSGVTVPVCWVLCLALSCAVVCGRTKTHPSSTGM